MLRLDEHTAKAWLNARGLPTPAGDVAATPQEAAALANAWPDAVMVKALVPTGRRGLAGAVIAARPPTEAADAASALLEQTVHSYPVRQVRVEERVEIARELYVAFSLSGSAPEILLSCDGGVDIEETIAKRPEAVTRQAIHPIRGLTSWDAIDLWSQAGMSGPALRHLGALTAALYAAFQAGDALLLEINPLAITPDGQLSLVGVMMGVDEDALFRHRDWAQIDEAHVQPGLSEREQRIARLNRDIPEGECQYIELQGDIGLLVGGGGAGLYQHDLMIELGGAPANHSVTPPTGRDTRKLKAVLEAIFDHPHLRGLLVGFNFAQMARADIRVRVLVEVLREKRIDTRHLPIVIRLFGAGEAEARALVADWPGIHYLPRGTSLRDGVERIVELTRQA